VLAGDLSARQHEVSMLAGAPPASKDPFYPPAQIFCGMVVKEPNYLILLVSDRPHVPEWNGHGLQCKIRSGMLPTGRVLWSTSPERQRLGVWIEWMVRRDYTRQHVSRAYLFSLLFFSFFASYGPSIVYYGYPMQSDPTTTVASACVSGAWRVLSHHSPLHAWLVDHHVRTYTLCTSSCSLRLTEIC
jgi:hypothetical protein